MNSGRPPVLPPAAQPAPGRSPPIPDTPRPVLAPHSRPRPVAGWDDPQLAADAVGFYHVRNRILLPHFGRFAAIDPRSSGLTVLGNPALLGQVADVAAPEVDAPSMFGNGANLSLYVGANPVVQRDPSGLFFDFGGLMGGSLVGNDLNSNTLDVGMSFLDAMRGFAGLFETRNAMLSALTGIASTGPNLGGIDAAIEIYNGFQDAQSALLAAGVVRAGVKFSARGAWSLVDALSERAGAALHRHHGIPMFMGGKPSFARLIGQIPYPVPAHLHNEFHGLLNRRLQEAGFPAHNKKFEKFLRDHPGKQKEAFEILRQVSSEFDARYGTSFTAAFDVNFLLGAFREW